MGAISPPVSEEHERLTEDQQRKAPAATCENPHAAIPVVIVAMPSPGRSPTPGTKHEDAEERWWWPPVPSNWALIVVTTVYAILAYRTLLTIRRQAESAEDVARIAGVSAQAAQTAADAATKNADIAARTLEHMELAERPWVAFRLIGDQGFDVLNELRTDPAHRQPPPIVQVDVRYAVTNVGRTVARVTAFSLVTSVEDPDELPPEPAYPRSDRQPPYALAPKASYREWVSYSLTKPARDDLLADRRALIVYGEVRYLDSGDSEHTTRFCMVGDFDVTGEMRFHYGGPDAYNDSS
jgi:hypothetical protein